MDLLFLQRDLPWGAHDYTQEFNARTHAARDFEHAYGHVMKAMGGVFEHVIDAHAHTGQIDREKAAKKIADAFICLVRMANTVPGGPVDVGEAIAARLAEKFPNVTLYGFIGPTKMHAKLVRWCENGTTPATVGNMLVADLRRLVRDNQLVPVEQGDGDKRQVTYLSPTGASDLRITLAEELPAG